ncbi:hypothetical protein RUND412_004661 [Rhizina undulata]
MSSARKYKSNTPVPQETKSKPFVQGSFHFSQNEICTYEYNNVIVCGGAIYLSLHASAIASISNASGDGNVAILADRVNLTALFIESGGEETDVPDGYTAETFFQAMSLVQGYVVNTDRARGFQCGISFRAKTFRNSVDNGRLRNTLLRSTSRDQFIVKIPTLSEINDALLREPLAITDANKSNVTFALSNGFSNSLTGNATVVTGTPEAGQVSEFHRAIYKDLANSTFEAWWIFWSTALWILTFVMLLAVCSGARNSAVGWLANFQLAAIFYGLDANMPDDVDGHMGLTWAGIRAMLEKRGRLQR